MIQALIRAEYTYAIVCCIYVVCAVTFTMSMRRFRSTWMYEPRGDTHEKTRASISLGQAASRFVGIHSLQLLMAGVAASLIIRVALGGWSIWDAVIVVATIAIWPFQEWLFHAYLLHLKPFRLLGRSFEPVFVKTHRNHHQYPREPISGVIPFYFVTVYLLGLPMVWHFGLPLAQAITGIATSLVLVLIYEWVHFLIHTTYSPKGRWFSSLSRNHHLHHFKNENHWYGVTTVVADVALGTRPANESIEKSETCLTLGPEDEI